jgi:Na+/H+ antiporter NhaD/arsenite permease-like protein
MPPVVVTKPESTLVFARSPWRRPRLTSAVFVLFALLLSQSALAAGAANTIDLTLSPVGIIALVLFVIAYAVVMGEEFLHMRKSKPVLVAAGLIWALIGWRYQVAANEATDDATKKTLSTLAEHAVRHNILEYAELFLFLLAAMTFINTMEERGVFNALRGWLVTKGFTLRQIFWITGVLAFFISPVADNLTTALLMGAVATAVGAGNTPFLVVAFINIVVAANAGGAFSPFGDITTLMVWQKGIIPFSGFFALFFPSLANWLVPAAFMSLAIGKSKPAALDADIELRHGAFVVVALFLATIAMAVSFHNFLHLPPVLGMMSGLGVLKLYGWTLKRRDHKAHDTTKTVDSDNPFEAMSHEGAHKKEFDIFRSVEKAEWDTLMFFYGVILCVGGLGTIGYLGVLSHFAYDGFGATTANIAVGVLSAIVDNIPVMFAVLSMHPEMDEGQWLLVTLTAGVGGSLLSIGSAAGVALMGQARGVYTFFAHLKWSWAIALGYVCAIGLHFLLNKSLFDGVPLAN